MANVAFNVQVELTTMNCGNCGGTYAINERFRKKKYEEGSGWNCPYCKCSWGYFGHSSEAEVLRKKLEEAERNRDWYKQRQADERAARERTERRLTASKGQQTKLRNRIKNGVCPCCTRTFSNLQRHMATQHPEFTPEPLEENNG